MPPDAGGPDDPRAWLRRARSNLARAQAGLPSPDVLFEDLCFDAQQAAEKALKAVLVSRRQTVERTHSIADLVTAVAALGLDVPEDVRRSAALTEYAVAARYPGPTDPVTAEDLDAAVASATAVLRWAVGVIEEHPVVDTGEQADSQ